MGGKCEQACFEESRRRGIATVEFAVIFPILLVMVLGTLEICQRLFSYQSATIAAYEGIRLAARSTSNALK